MRVLTLGSARSGSGKSFVAANLGVALARRGLRVCLVDLDLTASDLHLLLGLFRPERGLLELLRGEARSLAEILHPVGEGDRLWLIPGAGETVRALQPEEIQGLCEDIRGLPVDVAIVDLAAGTGQLALDFFTAADEAWVVAAADVCSVPDVVRFLRLARLRHVARRPAAGSPRRPRIYTSLDDLVRDMSALREEQGRTAAFRPGVLLNRCDAGADAYAARLMDGIEEEFPSGSHLPLVAKIPEDAAVANAFAALTPLLAHAPRSPAARAIEALADDFAGTAVAGPGIETTEPALEPVP